MLRASACRCQLLRTAQIIFDQIIPELFLRCSLSLFILCLYLFLYRSKNLRHILRRQRFQKVILCPAAQRLLGILEFRIAAQDYKMPEISSLLKLLHHLNSAHLWHTDIRNHHIRLIFQRHLVPLFTVSRLSDHRMFRTPANQARDPFSDLDFIFYH